MENDFHIWCCPKCGAEIGLIGRLMEWIAGTDFHNCGPNHYTCNDYKGFWNNLD